MSQMRAIQQGIVVRFLDIFDRQLIENGESQLPTREVIILRA